MNEVDEDNNTSWESAESGKSIILNTIFNSGQTKIYIKYLNYIRGMGINRA